MMPLGKESGTLIGAMSRILSRASLPMAFIRVSILAAILVSVLVSRQAFSSFNTYKGIPVGNKKIARAKARAKRDPSTPTEV